MDKKKRRGEESESEIENQGRDSTDSEDEEYLDTVNDPLSPVKHQDKILMA